MRSSTCTMCFMATLPVPHSLESRGGPPAAEGWKISRQSRARNSTWYNTADMCNDSVCDFTSAATAGRGKMASLGMPSTLTQGTELKSHSTLHRVSFADTATAADTAALPHSHKPSCRVQSEPTLGSVRGPLATRKAALEQKQSGSKGHNQSAAKVMQIH